MKFNKLIFGLLGWAMLAIGCTDGEPNSDKGGEGTQTPTNPTEKYVRLNQFCGCGYIHPATDTEMTRAYWDDANGSGTINLKWENVELDSYKTEELSLFLSDGEKPIPCRLPAIDGISDLESTYSGLAVTPIDGDEHIADFQTVNYYNVDSLQNAKYCYAWSGYAEITEDEEGGQHLCQLEMPSTFKQTASQDPSFLSEHMYMYATTTYKENRNILNFFHIPATIRFVINCTTDENIELQEASVSVSDEGAMVASQYSTLAFDWTNGQAELSFGEEGYNKIAVTTNNTSLTNGDTYTAYALVLPLADNNALREQNLCVRVKCNDKERIVYPINGAELANINGSDVYNWVSGKSYTIRINIQEEGKASGEILEGNRIEITSNEVGTYTLMYEGVDGLPLPDYTIIGNINIKDIAHYEDFIDVNVAPREAKCIGIYNTVGERQGSIPITAIRPDYAEKPLYSFGLLSDVHIGRQSITPDEDFRRALAFFNDKQVNHTCICGDITQDGTEAQLSAYQSIAITAEAPVYTTTGNHDCTYSGINTSLWTKYTGQPLVFEQSVEKNGQVDHYLFFGMNIWNFSSAYRAQDIEWLESKLEEYRNERCFIITHLFFPERAGNLNNIYPSGNWLTGIQLKRLQALCDHYVNSIWFSGHSHWEWQLQKYQDRANIYRTYDGFQPSSGWCVHVPSCGVPITSNGTSRVDNATGSEGAIVEVYENHIDIFGLDLKAGKYLPIATYRLDTTPQEVAEKEEEVEPPVQSNYIKASDFVYNPEKVAGATVTDVEGMPDYVEVTFTAKGQGFWVTNSTFTASSSSVSIVVEDMKTLSNGVEIEVPTKCGFYAGSDYYMTSTDAAKVYSGQGVQFQTSNSGYGSQPLPLTVRMKVKMAFN